MAQSISNVDDGFSFSYKMDQFINLHNIPELDLQKRRGKTDYIDFVSVKDLHAPMMQGRDVLKRRFLCLRVGSSNRMFFKHIRLYRVAR